MTMSHEARWLLIEGALLSTIGFIAAWAFHQLVRRYF